ncbi:hypothetical protein CVT26_009194 [Gymnopilus dilepis]|uniref:Beta/gamma crystallin 'Greek key' domain-containing protein n=1 Tax=Gymnopilus dilepis TaxID=231916 RepID=A0A409Y9C3_9AGAR|nr:hypothetical protein CVT26_009194 [Gymnopilus dilepis]
MFSSVIKGFAALAMVAVPGFASVLLPRQDGSIFMCTDANSGGTCASVDFTFEVCSSIPAVINDQVSSLQVPRGVTCTIFADGGCSGHFIRILGPGEPNLGNNNFNDQMSSFQCIPGCSI